MGVALSLVAIVNVEWTAGLVGGGVGGVVWLLPPKSFATLRTEWE